MTEFAEIDLEGFRPATLTDQPAPQLQWVPIGQLVIDRAYQREISGKGRSAIQRIADGFDWTKYQPIQLAPLEGGRFAIVDGQHRAHAAALVGLEALPAMIVPMSARQQASGFAAMNRDRIKVGPLQIYRAELTAGTKWALDCRDAVEAGGCTLAFSTWSAQSKKPGMVFAIGLIRRMVSLGEGAAVTAGLAGIRKSDFGQHAESYTGPILAVWLRAVATNQRFMRLDLAAIFDALDIEHELIEARARARQTGGAARQIATDAVVARLREALQEAAA